MCYVILVVVIVDDCGSVEDDVGCTCDCRCRCVVNMIVIMLMIVMEIVMMVVVVVTVVLLLDEILLCSHFTRF